jgi:PEP-CTERM motif
MSLSGFTKALVVVGFSAFSSMASAGFIQTFVSDEQGGANDCSGEFGQGFENCKIPANFDPNESPIIIKFELNENGTFSTEINSVLFPSIDGNEFSFDFTGEGATGTWTYTPGAGDPAINFFVAKGGPGFNLFDTLGLTDDWYTPDNRGGNPAGLSHLSFYDTGGGGQVPEPTTLLLLGAGLFAAGFARRRVKHN